MNRKRQPNPICFGSDLAALVLSAALTLGTLCSPTWAAGTGTGGATGTTSTSSQTTISQDEISTSYIDQKVKDLVKEGYAVDGPSEVVEVGRSSLTIFKTGKTTWKLSLADKNVKISDYQGQTLSLSQVQSQSKVYTCQKKSNVVILVLKKKEGTNEY
ncbi:hypothetical protein [Desulfomonile tiedjei]|uniref:Uncharacterized protein n=1 Tax=Desulfomonile tiedjei (strain ATCC 49306 / DSM 6799 / DCB-1) TaxID=706587 RepID=I4C5H4_DESTA|nr:hypothetical protein [Desulfomonile tiedjei]AFM24815.1 hypothetical protein Desti_2116 [Desulfomonile tiedjei DSM 6799]